MGCKIDLPIHNEYEYKQKTITVENLNQFIKERLIKHVHITNILPIIYTYVNINNYDIKIINYQAKMQFLTAKNITRIPTYILRECIEYAIQINHITLFDQIFKEIICDFNHIFPGSGDDVYWSDRRMYVDQVIKRDIIIIECVKLCRIELITSMAKHKLYHPEKNMMNVLEWIRNNNVVEYLTNQNLKIGFDNKCKLNINSMFELASKHGYKN